MANLSISAAWDETVAFVRREGRLLFPLAFMLIALPVALMQAFTPPPPAPDQPPAAGLWLLLIPLSLGASMIGNLAISYLALRPGTAVGESISQGARRFLPLLGSVLMVGVAGIVLLFLAVMIAVMLVPGALEGAAGGVPTEAMGYAILLAVLLLLPALVYFSARLLPMTPLAAVEPVGSFRIIARAWELTKGQGLKLVGFVLLIGLAYAIGTTAIESVAGIAIRMLVGPLEPGSLALLLVIILMAGVNTVIGPYVTSLIARIYAQLAPQDHSGVFT